MSVEEKNGVIWVRHEGRGGSVDGAIRTARIRQYVRRSGYPPVVVHDARKLRAVDDQYIKQFKELEPATSLKVRETLCIAPDTWLRTLFRSVASLSPGRWSFYTSIDPVLVRLAEPAKQRFVTT